MIYAGDYVKYFFVKMVYFYKLDYEYEYYRGGKLFSFYSQQVVIEKKLVEIVKNKSKRLQVFDLLIKFFPLWKNS